MEPIVKWVSSTEVKDAFVRQWLAMYERHDVKALVKNVQTTVRCLCVNDELYFPVTVNDKEWDNSYVVSPYNMYAPYAKEELEREVKNKLLVMLIKPLIALLGVYLRMCNINRVVHVNNFILSTNPYPVWCGQYTDEICQFIKEHYPRHAIVFRSLNDCQHTATLSATQQSGLINIASRQVYMYTTGYEEWKIHRNNYLDQKVIRKNQLTYIDNDEMRPHLVTAAELYNKLYLDKYSKHNPQFTLQYFTECYDNGIIYFQGYTKDGLLKAFSGAFVYGGTITSPLVGYDTSAPVSDGLYIHAAGLAFKYKFKTSLTLNLSSGAASFKRLRGGMPYIEYSAVCYKHLPRRSRTMFRILAFVSNGLGVRLLKKYKL